MNKLKLIIYITESVWNTSELVFKTAHMLAIFVWVATVWYRKITIFGLGLSYLGSNVGQILIDEDWKRTLGQMVQALCFMFGLARKVMIDWDYLELARKVMIDWDYVSFEYVLDYVRVRFDMLLLQNWSR